jgi:hypothetical protein
VVDGLAHRELVGVGFKKRCDDLVHGFHPFGYRSAERIIPV